MIIVGLNAYHGDVSAAIVRDGQLIAAIEEERFRRIKHCAGFPHLALAECLRMAGATPADVDVFAVSRDPRAHLWRKALYLLRHRPRGTVGDRARNVLRIRSLPDTIAASLGLDPARVRRRTMTVEHHPAHLASAAYVSGFDDAAVCAIDGFGDFVSTSWGVLDGTRVGVRGRVYFPHSLGMLYLAVTQYLGFPKYGDEFKVMGLAPYGEPAFTREIGSLVNVRADGGFELDLSYFRHWSEGVSMTWDDGEPTIGTVFTPKLEALLGPARKPSEPLTARHEALAASLQAVFEDAAMGVLNHVQRSTGRTRLCYAGGCAMNSVANGKIRSRTAFTDVFIQPASGDNGTALGAAFEAWHRHSKAPRAFVMEHGYWGPEFNGDADCRRSRRRARPDPDGGLHPPRAAGRRRPDGVDRAPDRRRPRRRLVPRPHGVGRPRARQPQHPGGSAPRRHARDHQHAHQVSRALPAVRAVHPRERRPGVLRRRRRRSVHAARLSDSSREARARAGDHTRGRLRPAADGQPAVESVVLGAHHRVPRHHRRPHAPQHVLQRE